MGKTENSDCREVSGFVKDDVTGPYLPTGPAMPCAAPASALELQTLLEDLSKDASLTGTWTISRDGLPVAIVRARSEEQFRRLREGITGVFAWGWDGVFGTLISFTLAGKESESATHARIFLAPDNPFIRRFKESGKAAFAASWAGKVGHFFTIDFANSATHRDGPLVGFRRVSEFSSNDFRFRDDKLSYWQLLSMPGMPWTPGLSPTQLARAAWADSFTRSSRVFWNGIAELRERRSEVDAVEPVKGALPSYRAIQSLAQAIVDPRADCLDVFRLFESMLLDEDLRTELFEALRDPKVEVDEPILGFISFGLTVAAMGPRVTAYGTRKPWLEARNASRRVRMHFTVPDLAKIGTPECYCGKTYWDILHLSEIFDVGECLTGSDIPLDKTTLAVEIGQSALDSPVDCAASAVESLLAEAGEHRQWSVPWGARVQIAFGPLKWMDVFELEGEFVVLFRDGQERYLSCAMNVESGSFACPSIFQEAAGKEPPARQREDLEAALLLIAASAIRDFLVVEERESTMATRPTKDLRRRCPTNSDLSVIYLPRVRYTAPDLESLHATFESYRPRAAHTVAAHLRKTNQPSAEQLILAHRYGFSVPTGYTFVRPHRRGAQETVERTKIYRSRSASSMLYQTVTTPAGQRPRWFDFERDVANYMRACGLQAIHQAASRSRDGGVDVYAHHPQTEEIVAIQCKCYAPARKVGPEVIRELKGALARYPTGTRGRVVTTSAFTSGAIDEAQSLGIELVDGKQWADILRLAPA